MKPIKSPRASKVEFSRKPTRRNGLPTLLNLAVVAIAILASSATLTYAQNVLVNPGFESGYGPWVTVPTWAWKPLNEFSGVQSTNGLVYPSPTVHVSVHGGTNALKIWGYNQPYTVPDGLMQTLACAAGSTWAASGWLNTQVPDNMTSTEFAYLEVQFLDSSSNSVGLGGQFLSPNLTPASPTSTWTYLEVVDQLTGDTNLVAPSGTAFIRFIMRFSQPGGYPGGSCYYDDMQLVKTSKPDPEITVQPSPLTKVYGQTAVFSVVADGVTALSYKWQKGGGDITNPNAHGVTADTLTISNVTVADNDAYTVTVTDQAGPLTSDPANLIVQDPGVIAITPALGQTKTDGASASFSVSAAGSSALSYQWQFNGNPLNNGGRITGALSSALTVANVSAADAGTYTVAINGGAVQASSGLMVVPASQVATNLLNNPGFEYGVLAEPWESGWNGFGGAALATVNDFYYDATNAAYSTTPVSVYDGNYVSRTYVTAADNGLYQPNVPAVAGGTYHVGGRFYVSSLDPITGAAWVVLQLMFKDSTGTTIQPTLASYQIGTNFTTDTWTYIQITNNTGGLDLVAPASTALATCQVYEYAQAGGGGSVYFDDLYVTKAVATPTAVTMTPWESGGTMYMAFPSASGVTYEVLYANSLTSPITWYTNSTVIGDGGVKTVSDPIGATQRYYRLLEHH